MHTNKIENVEKYRAIDRLLRKLAERYWYATTCTKILLFVIGIISIALPNVFKFSTISIFIISLISEILRFLSIEKREKYEILHRELDLAESFGWTIPTGKYSELIVNDLEDDKSGNKCNSYFTSKTPLGAIKAIENILESSMHTKYTTKKAMQYFLSISIILFLVFAIILVSSIYTINDPQALTKFVQIAISTVMIVFSADLITTGLRYFKLSKKAEEIEKQSLELLKNKNEDYLKAIRLWNEYHLARAIAPLAPSWIWKKKREKLNKLFLESVSQFNQNA